MRGRRRMKKKKKQWVRNGLWYESITYLFSDAFHLDSWDNGWSTNLSLKHETCLWSSLFFDWLMKNVLKPSQKTCPGSLSWLECMPHVSRRVFTAAAQVWFWHGPMPSSLSVCLSLAVHVHLSSRLCLIKHRMPQKYMLKNKYLFTAVSKCLSL